MASAVKVQPDLGARLADARARLRATLLAGDNTAAVRAEIKVIEQSVADESAARAVDEAERQRQTEATVQSHAQQIADGVEMRLAAAIAVLQPPPPPVCP